MGTDPQGIARDAAGQPSVDRDGLNDSSDAVHAASHTYKGVGGTTSGYRPDGARELGDPRGNIQR